MAFDQRPLTRDITQYKTDVSLPTSELEIVVPDAQQIFPPGNAPPSNLLLITAGTIRFGWDGGNPLEDQTNEFSEESEVDRGVRKTVVLNLNDIPSGQKQFVGASAFAALGNCGLTREDDFLVAVDNAGVAVVAALVGPAEPTPTPTDIVFLSDVLAAGTSSHTPLPSEEDSLTQLNRLGYQAMVLLKIPK
jgi:hypothetical protein